jgi:hypothetical protein
LFSRVPARERTWDAVAALLALLHFGSFPWRDHPFATDLRIFLYYAARTAKGAWPHLDFFENKTPLAFFVGAALDRVGTLLGVEGFVAVRLGYVALAAFNAWLAYRIHSRLWGSRMAGLLGMAPYLAVPILGGLPAIGNVPKLLMAVCASGAALLAARRSWPLVGVLGGLAILDWQVGGLVVIAGCVAAAVSGDDRRWRASLAVAVGALMPVLAMLGLYAALGGLKAFVEQTVLSSVSRGVTTAATLGVVADWPRRFQLILASPYSRPVVAALALPGLVLQVLAPGRTLPALLPVTAVVAVYHASIMAFSLLDFQVYGDLFILYNSLAFLAGTALCWLFREAEKRTLGRSPKVVLLPRAGALLVGLALVQPWVSRQDVRIVPRPPGVTLTLEEQRALADRLKPLLTTYRVAVLGPAELLLLTGSKNPILPVYWNYATHAYFRKTREEGMGETLRRILREASCDFLICDREFPQGRCAEALGSFPRRQEISPGGYGVDIYDVRGMRGDTTP